MTKRVVITGMGVVSSVGNDVPTFWRNLLDGYCGIDFVEDFFGNDLPVKIAGNVKNFNAEDFGMDKSFIRKQDKFTQFGMAAAYQAMNDSGLCSEGEEANIDPFRLGVYVGSGIGGFEVQFRETAKMIEDPSGKWISPLFIPTMISNIAAGHIAIKHHAEGPCLDIVTACATSSHCIARVCRCDHRRRKRACDHSDRHCRIRQCEGPFPRRESEICLPPLQPEPAGICHGRWSRHHHS